MLTIITSLLHHYYIIITPINGNHYYNCIITYYYIIITLLLSHNYFIITSLLQKGNHVIMIALIHVMQMGCLHYYVIFTHFYANIAQTSIITHYYPFSVSRTCRWGRSMLHKAYGLNGVIIVRLREYEYVS